MTEHYIDGPFHEVLLTGVNESGDDDAQFVTPRIPLLDLKICGKSFVFDSLLTPRCFRRRLPARVLFPVSSVFREERLASMSDMADVMNCPTYFDCEEWILL